eukprot:TRINITY_DN28220_c0_g1_i1.p1 TRINITY_DN28220_c0_g1~~TRINITY_DN28220_c0_g1_i1.p1  ORF type:complete len:309 (-),score=-5.82 TRINITY_DN28220_c0_g1_i1:491-1417(-)
MLQKFEFVINWIRQLEDQELKSRQIAKINVEFVTQKLNHYGGCFLYNSLSQKEPVIITLGQLQKFAYVPKYKYSESGRQLEGVLDAKTLKFLKVENNLWIKKIEVYLEVLDQMIVGSLLGDLGIHHAGYIEVCQKPPEYVFYKYQFLRQFCTETATPFYIERLNSKTKKWFCQWRFSTRCLFKSYQQLFYTQKIDGKNRLQKAVPAHLQQMLISPLALSFLIQDDGKKQDSTLHICCQGFKVFENFNQIQLLRKVLNENFGLQCSIDKIGNIRIRSKSYWQLDKMIRPLILPIFQYKLQPKKFTQPCQ